MEVTIQEVTPLIMDCLQAGLVPNLIASPGVGKSDCIRSIAKTNNLKVIDLRLAQMDPTDLNGFPTLNEDRSRSHYAPPSIIPIEGDRIPDGFDGWLLFLDEMNSAPMSVQAAAYKVVLDKAIGEHKIHPNVAIVCAGNKATDKAIVSRLSTAMQSRLIHFQIRVDQPTWINWAIEEDIDYRITAFIRFRPDLLHKFDPEHDDVTFPCPRTWEFMSMMSHKWETIPLLKVPLMAGTIGEGPALEFKGFTDIFETLPTKDDIIMNPTGIAVPTEPSTLFAISALLAKVASAVNIDPVMIYILRLPIEFQVIALQSILKDTRELLETKPVKDWISINASELL